MPHRPSRPPLSRATAFTLVELLVVIGIIALLISILLPALSKARKSALTIKCASALRQVGMGFQLYANEQKGWWPCALYTPASGNNYVIDDNVYDSVHRPYWFNFVAKYVNVVRAGNATSSVGIDAGEARKSVLWGCPAWQQYQKGSIEVQLGYGMNIWPTTAPDYPALGTATPPSNESIVYSEGSPPTGTFLKQTQWTRPAERCLCADSKFWAVESEPVPTALTYPPSIAAQVDISNSVTYTGAGQTMIDVHRHGTYPSHLPDGTFDPYGGAISFNILYCDGHVSTTSDAKQAYLSTRQRFPN
jgi:prepilin-type processing-associated H-X9-DG protein